VDRYDKWTSKTGRPHATIIQVGDSESKFDDGTPVFKDGAWIYSIEFTSEEDRERWLAKNFKEQHRAEKNALLGQEG